MTELQRLAIEHGIHASPRVLEAFAIKVEARTKAKCLGACTEFTRHASEQEVVIARQIMDRIKKS